MVFFHTTGVCVSKGDSEGGVLIRLLSHTKKNLVFLKFTCTYFLNVNEYATMQTLGYVSSISRSLHAGCRRGRALMTQELTRTSLNSSCSSSSSSTSTSVSRSFASSSSSSTTQEVQLDAVREGDQEAIHRIIMSRFACKKFDPSRAIDAEVVRKLLALTLVSFPLCVFLVFVC